MQKRSRVGCTYGVMDAMNLEVSDASYDVVLDKGDLAHTSGWVYLGACHVTVTTPGTLDAVANMGDPKVRLEDRHERHTMP